MVTCYVCLDEGAQTVCRCTNVGLHSLCARDLRMYGMETCSVCLQPIQYAEETCTCQRWKSHVYTLSRCLSVIGWLTALAGLVATLLLHAAHVEVSYSIVIVMLILLFTSSLGVMLTFEFHKCFC